MIFSFFSDFLASSYISVAATSNAKQTSSPGLYPAFSIASTIKDKASSSSLTSGANPPSSPTPVAKPFAF